MMMKMIDTYVIDIQHRELDGYTYVRSCLMIRSRRVTSVHVSLAIFQTIMIIACRCAQVRLCVVIEVSRLRAILQPRVEKSIVGTTMCIVQSLFRSC